MSDNKLKKMILFSDLNIKNICDECIKKEATERNISERMVIEEYLITGIIRNFPDATEELKNIYRRRYEKYIDKEVLKTDIPVERTDCKNMDR